MHLPHQPRKSVRVNCTLLAWCIITLTLPNLTKSHKNYLQNTQHMVLRNRPTLIIGTERLACLNSPPGVARCARFSPPSLPSSLPEIVFFAPRLARGRSRVQAPGPAGALRALFFSTLPSFLLPEIVFFAPSPPTPQKC